MLEENAARDPLADRRGDSCLTPATPRASPTLTLSSRPAHKDRTAITGQNKNTSLQQQKLLSNQSHLNSLRIRVYSFFGQKGKFGSKSWLT